MKRKFSKILGVGLTLALLTSLLLTAAPVSALGQPTVTPTNATISVTTPYSILFTLGKDLPDVTGTITIGFPTGTDLTAVAAGDISLLATSGIGSGAITTSPTFVTVVKSPSTTTGPTVTITLPDITGETKIGMGAMVQVVVADVQNPGTVGSYTLTVATSAEAAVTSAAYTIVIPTIPVLPGIVKVYNPSGVLMTQMTGDNAIYDAIAAAGASYTIVVGAGEYDIEAGKELSITAVTLKGLTLKSSDGATTTIIDGALATDMVIDVFAANVTIDGFTIKNGGNRAIYLRNTGFTVQNNIITTTLGDGIIVESSNNVIALGLIDSNIITGKGLSATAYRAGILVEGYGANAISGVTVSNNTVSAYGTAAAGGVMDTSGIRVAKATGTGAISVTVTGNNISGNYTGLYLWGDLSGMSGTKAIANNTITGNYTGVVIQSHAGADDAAVFSLVHNTITDNTKYGIQFGAGSSDLTGGKAIMFNVITGNGTYGIYNATTTHADDPVATFNWWGTSVASEVAAMVSGAVIYTPFLTGTADAVFSADAVAVSATLLDAKTAVGVAVVNTTTAADVIVVAEYTANPEEAIANALAFFDVYVVGTTALTDDVTIKFYTGDGNSKLYIWSRDTDQWVDLSGDASFGFSVYGGYMFITVDADLLGRTPFVVVTPPAVPAVLLAPVLAAPNVGAEDVSLTPTFAWGTVPGADGYYFQLADNAYFAAPRVKLDGDQGRLPVTAYHYVTELDYSDSYYWRVKAVSGTVAAGNLAEGDWVYGVFGTIAEPEEAPAEVWMCSEGLTFDTREALEAHLATAAAHQPVEAPDIIVPLPAETPITPAWIYAIIGVGAVLVIAVIVLIVRTRRVA